MGGSQNWFGRRGEEKILVLPGLELRHSVVQPVAIRCIDCAIPVPIFVRKVGFILIRFGHVTILSRNFEHVTWGHNRVTLSLEHINRI
jgi:hypothetical protein